MNDDEKRVIELDDNVKRFCTRRNCSERAKYRIEFWHHFRQLNRKGEPVPASAYYLCKTHHNIAETTKF